ncbi:MAG: NAD(P)/FAD-dependent oxidoreductase [bacterium]|nr:NAD(P)/FAD-dependent oxidoreductase [bacterium]
MDDYIPAADCAVIGGGLSGLAAAALVARGGARVVLLERAPAPGGRAATRVEEGFHLNLGPHALYRGGPAETLLRELDVAIDGGMPPVSGAFALDRGHTHALPGGLVSLLTTGLFGLGAKLETARLLAGLGRVDPEPWQARPLAEWVATSVQHPDVRRLVLALTRVSSYANAPDAHSAGAAIGQLQHALRRGVLYLHGGWQTLVDGLRDAAVRAGVEIRTGAAATALLRDAAGDVMAVRLRDGTTIPARSAILALPAADAAPLLPEGEVRRAAAEAVPVRAACLDVALRALPRPGAVFALGVDTPSYLSVHTAVARLAPAGGAVVHVMRYLEPDPPPAKVVEQSLEATLDLVQPGWRAAVVTRRFLPGMLAASALVRAAQGGLRGRPGPQVTGAANCAVAGDWVGPEGCLADASLASARRAAALVTARLRPAAAAA